MRFALLLPILFALAAPLNAQSTSGSFIGYGNPKMIFGGGGKPDWPPGKPPMVTAKNIDAFLASQQAEVQARITAAKKGRITPPPRDPNQANKVATKKVPVKKAISITVLLSDFSFYGKPNDGTFDPSTRSYTFQSKQSQLRHVAYLESCLKRPELPGLDPDGMVEGQIGTLTSFSGDGYRVLHVLPDGSALISYPFWSWTFFLSGNVVKTLREGQGSQGELTEFPGVYTVTETRNYTATNGSPHQVRLISEYDFAPHLAKLRAATTK